MKIIVDGKEAQMKKGSSFEYVSENPLFTEASDYSMNIEFPLKDCPQNILIFGALCVKGVDISKVSFPCEIITESFDKTGIIAITGVSDVRVKGQFLEGMSQQNFSSSLPDTYITDIDFSDYDGTNHSSESYQRVFGSGWDNMVIWDSKKESPIYSQEGEPGAGGWTCRHIYLYHLVKLIAQKCGFSVDDTILRSIPMYLQVIVVNTGYCKIDRHGYESLPSLARNLPHWTVKEFFDEVGKFFGCIYTIDSSNSKIVFTAQRLTSTVSGVTTSVKVNLTVKDNFSVEMQENKDPEYRGNVKYKLPDECDPDKVNMCSWIANRRYLYYLESRTEQSFAGLIQAAAWGDANSITNLMHKRTLFYLTDLNKYAVITNYEVWNREGWDEEEEGRPEYLFCQYELLDQFGDFREGEELGIAPCPLTIKSIWYKPNLDGSKGASTAHGFRYKMPVVEVPTDREIEQYNTDYPTDEILEIIKNGEENEIEYYKKLWIVIHSGTMNQNGFHINTRKYEPEGALGRDYASYFGSEWDHEHSEDDERSAFPVFNYRVHEYLYTLSPADPTIQTIAELPKVDETKLYKYKFLSKTIPDVKAIFVIRGKEYACQKITAHFSVDGMSEELEGEFYEIIG